MHLETIRHVITGKSPFFGMLFSSSLGLGAAEFMGMNVNTVVIVALCGAAGAFFGCLPRLVTAMSGADATARALLSKELRMLLVRIHRLEQRVVLEQSAKHNVQAEHQSLALHVTNLLTLLRLAGAEVPVVRIATYEEMFGETDRAIKKLMLGEPEE